MVLQVMEVVYHHMDKECMEDQMDLLDNTAWKILVMEESEEWD